MLYVLFLFSLQHFYVILFLLLFAFQIIGQLDNMFIQNFQKFANKMRFKNVIKCKLSRTLYNNNDNSMTPPDSSDAEKRISHQAKEESRT